MIHLDSLQKYDAPTASKILATLVLASTENPGVGEAADFQTYDAASVEVLDELRVRLNLGALDERNARPRLLEALSKQLYEQSMRGKDRNAILARAGNNGRLTPSMYEVTFSRDRPQWLELGIRESHVVDAVMSPDAVQHFEVSSSSAPLSLFVKLHANRTSERSFWLLVNASRHGRVLGVEDAFRIYSDDLGVSAGGPPIELLRAFSQKFGFDCKLDNEVSKFFYMKMLPNKVNQRIDFSILGVKGKCYASELIGRFAPNIVPSVLVAFAINLTQYEEYLRARGVRTNLDQTRAAKAAEIRLSILPGEAARIF